MSTLPIQVFHMARSQYCLMGTNLKLYVTDLSKDIAPGRVASFPEGKPFIMGRDQFFSSLEEAILEAEKLNAQDR